MGCVHFNFWISTAWHLEYYFHALETEDLYAPYCFFNLHHSSICNHRAYVSFSFVASKHFLLILLLDVSAFAAPYHWSLSLFFNSWSGWSAQGLPPLTESSILHLSYISHNLPCLLSCFHFSEHLLTDSFGMNATYNTEDAMYQKIGSKFRV